MFCELELSRCAQLRTARLVASILLISTLIDSTGAFTPSMRTISTPGRPSFTFRSHGPRNKLPRFRANDGAEAVSARKGGGLFMTAKSEGKKRLAAGMAFMTGWCDVFLLLKFETFATMMTGNAMKMALAVVEGGYRDVAYFGSVILSYVAGLVAFRRADLALREKTMYTSAVAVTGLFIGSDVWYATSGGARWIPVMLLASAFGIINSVGTEVAGTLTFVITGHMTRLTNQFVDRLSRTAGRKPLTAEGKMAAVQNAAVLCGFVGGAIFAGFLVSRGLLNTSGVFSAMGVLYGLLFVWQDMEALGGAWWKRKEGAMCDLDDDGGLCDVTGN